MMHAMCFYVNFGGLSCSLRSSASRTLLVNSFDGLLMSPFCDLCVERPQLHRRGAEDGVGVVQVRHV